MGARDYYDLWRVLTKYGAGLECAGVFVNASRFTKTSRCWDVANNAGGTNTNRVVLFRKA